MDKFLEVLRDQQEFLIFFNEKYGSLINSAVKPDEFLLIEHIFYENAFNFFRSAANGIRDYFPFEESHIFSLLDVFLLQKGISFSEVQ